MRWIALLAPLVAASVARASAPLDQYGPFSNASAVIVDQKTKLVWQRDVDRITRDWQTANDYCSKLTLGDVDGGTPIAWRVPSYKELLTLVDETPHAEYQGTGPVQTMIDPQAFGLDQSGHWFTPTDADYWTSSPYAPDPSSDAWAVDFGSGLALHDAQHKSKYVRCVH